MLNPEYVTARVGGRDYDGWESVTIDAAINEATRTFTLETTEFPGEWNFPPSTPIEIRSNGDLFVAGYTNRFSPKGDARNHGITISGRGKGQDFVDCAALHPSGYVKNKTPAQFADELDHFGVGVRAAVPLRAIPRQVIEQGATAFDTIETYLRPQGATQMGLADGSIEITNASVAKRHSGTLMEAWNIKTYSGEITDDRKFSETTVKGQAQYGKGEANLRIAEKATDATVKRFRPRILVNETETDIARARDRANHEKERAAGMSIKCTIGVQGWRDQAGQPFHPNWLIYVYSPILLHIQQDMLIEKVSWRQGPVPNGSTAELHLVDPRTYRGKAGKSGSDEAWGTG